MREPDPDSGNGPYAPGTRTDREAAARVLVVDDDASARESLVKILGRLGYQTEEARDGVEALTKLALDIDLVLTDASMPLMDGFQVIERIRGDPESLDLPIVMITGLDSHDDRLRAMEAGVNDFITKPYDVTELRLRVAWLVRMKKATDTLKQQQVDLETTVRRRTHELRRSLEETVQAQRATYAAHLDTIRRLVLAAEYKDRDTAAHIERIGSYCTVLGRAFGMSPRELEILRYAAQMHDVGKLGVPDRILLKEGPLTDEEWAVMKRHTTVGGKILEGSPSELLQEGRMIALSHHERWDGTGYPEGLEGEAIPLQGRMCAVADVFDALSHDRHYRDALPLDTVYEMLEAGRGKHFDPEVLDVFMDLRGEIEEVRARSSDPEGAISELEMRELSHPPEDTPDGPEQTGSPASPTARSAEGA